MSNEELLQRIEELERQLREHTHNGFMGGLINVKELTGNIKTITASGDLTNILGSTPQRLTDQIIIDATTATKKLYIYDVANNVWCNIAISAGGLTGTNTIYVANTSGGSPTHAVTIVEGIITNYV